MPQDSYIIQSVKHALKAAIIESLLKLGETVLEFVNIARRQGGRYFIAFKV